MASFSYSATSCAKLCCSDGHFSMSWGPCLPLTVSSERRAKATRHYIALAKIYHTRLNVFKTHADKNDSLAKDWLRRHPLFDHCVVQPTSAYLCHVDNNVTLGCTHHKLLSPHQLKAISRPQV